MARTPLLPCFPRMLHCSPAGPRRFLSTRAREEGNAKSKEAASTVGGAATALGAEAGLLHDVSARMRGTREGARGGDGVQVHERCVQILLPGPRTDPQSEPSPLTSQALESFLPETASEMCGLVLAQLQGEEEEDECSWFSAMQLMEVAGSCMVRTLLFSQAH
jgi:hypothetical protein